MLAVLAVALITGAGPTHAAEISALPDCRAEQLSLATDGEGGAFDGMSHSGALLVLRNLGPTACKTAALPVLRFEDANHRALTIVRSVPAGMHPGPVVPPVQIAAGAEATAPMRWVSGDVYDGHHCVSPAAISLGIGGQRLSTAVSARLCGPAHQTIHFDQTWLKIDPTLR